MIWYAHPESWRFIVRGYLPRLTLFSLAWEILQLPLYTIWQQAPPGRIAVAVAHCTAGDVMIGAAVLLLALILNRARQPADWSAIRIGTVMVMLAVFYTLFSERLNIAQGNWAYSSWMPVLPWVEVGLSPLLQWLVVPLAALHGTKRRRRADGAIYPPTGDR